MPSPGTAARTPGRGRSRRRRATCARLLADVRAAIKSRRTLSQAVADVGVSGGDWLLVDAFHRRNVTAAYAELEWEE